MTSKEKEELCKQVIDVLREHKDSIQRPVLITHQTMDVLQWKLRQSVKVQVDGVDVSCVADDHAPLSFTDAVADACKPEMSWQERAERAEAELKRYTAGFDAQKSPPDALPDIDPEMYYARKRSH